MATICVCSSANFYQQAVEVEAELQKLGYNVVLPKTAYAMKKSGDFEVSHYKTWFADINDYHKKAALIQAHFDEVAQADAVLVLNYEKHGVPNYIGGNVLMEMSLAFYLKKSIFVLNDLPEESSFIEEIRGLGSVPLHGQVKAIKKHL